MKKRPMRKITDLTWKDAILIELQSMTDRVERDMPVSKPSLDRLTAMITEHWHPAPR